MRAARSVLLGVLLILTTTLGNPRAQVPGSVIVGTGGTTFYGIGDVLGGNANSIVQEATQVGSTIYAVGASTKTATNTPIPTLDTAVVWDSVSNTLTEIPDLVTFGAPPTAPTSVAYAITPDAQLVASRARNTASNQNFSQGIRVPRTSVNSPLGVNAFSALDISDDGSILWGQQNVDNEPPNASVNNSRATRFDVSGGSPTRVQAPLLTTNLAGGCVIAGTNPVPPPPQTCLDSLPAYRGMSSDGSVLVGTAFKSVFTINQNQYQTTNGLAFRWVFNQPNVEEIPRPAGGTWSSAIAVSPDGNLTLAGGNSSEFRLGEVWIHNASTGTIQELGSPNTAFTPRLYGGMTADGSVVGVTFTGGSPLQNPGFNNNPLQYAYLHNSHNWFHLANVLADEGVDLWAGGWNPTNMVLTGIRTVDTDNDGTPDVDLVFGQGRRRNADGSAGSPEGFVAAFPFGVLSSYQLPAAAPVANQALVGAWALGPDPNNPPSVLVFTAGGTYYTITPQGDPAAGFIPGARFERGVYTLTTGNSLTLTTTEDRDGAGPSQTPTPPFAFNGLLSALNGRLSLSAHFTSPDTFVVEDATCTPVCSIVQGTRIAGGASSIVGGWIFDNPNQFDARFVVVFLGSSSGYKYFEMSDSETTESNNESDAGTYTWDAEPPRQLIMTPFFGSPDSGTTTATLTRDELGLTVVLSEEDGDVFTFDLTRVVAPETVLPAITNATLEASGTQDGPFSFTITATNALSFSATGLPAGVTLDPDTGVISGIPTVSGIFTVAITVTNTFGDTDTALLDLTIDNTLPGDDVTVTSGGSTLSLTFESVTDSGVTEITAANLAVAPALPIGFTAGASPLYFLATTTAGYNGAITACVTTGQTDFQGAAPHLFFFDGTSWIKTQSVVSVPEQVCGTTTSLGYFVVMSDTRFRGIGDLPGGLVGSAVRDATKVGGTIVAVGSSVSRQVTCTSLNPNLPTGCLPPPATIPSLDSPVAWDSSTGVLTALPPGPGVDFATQATNQIFAFAITPNGQSIAAQSHFNTTGSTGTNAVRVDNVDGTWTNVNLASQNIATTVPNPPNFAWALSDNGNIVYAQQNNARAVRLDVSGSTDVVPLPLPTYPDGTATTQSAPTARATSSDGNVVVGVAANAALNATNGQAFRFVYGAGPGTTTAIPRLSGGTWNFPVALTPDGRFTVVAGNSADFSVNGEIYLHDAIEGTSTRLGTPNSAMAPKMLGGITADGQALAVTFTDQFSGFFSLPSGGRHAYVHNPHGWWPLPSILTAHGIDLAAGWDPANMLVSGIRSVDTNGNGVIDAGVDSELIFGQGRRRTLNAAGNGYNFGAHEGFVAELPAGTLAAFNVPVSAEEDVDPSIVGAWAVGDPQAPGSVIVFFANGTYYRINKTALSPGVGFERGRFTWNGNGTTIATTPLFDTDGSIGSSSGVGRGLTLTITGNTASFADPYCPGCGSFSVSRITESVPQSLAGAWRLGDPAGTDSVVIVLLANNTYYFALDVIGENDSEIGTFTNAAGVLNMTRTAGDGGGLAGDPIPFTLSADGLTLTLTPTPEDGGGIFPLLRVVHPATVVPVITSATSASGEVSAPFSYLITATHGLTFDATGLPPELSVNTATGEIAGTPTTIGAFSVTIVAINSFGGIGSATLALTVGPAVTPTAQNGALGTTEDTAVSGALAASDPNGDPLTFTLLGTGTFGSAVLTNATTGAFTYTPHPNAFGSDSVTFRVSDGVNNSNVATVTVTIAPVNDPPNAGSVGVTMNEDTLASATLAASDVDGPALTFSLVSNGTLGTATITNSATGQFTYSPSPDVTGTDSFTFQVSDGLVTSGLGTVEVTIVPVDDIPAAFNVVVTTSEGVAVTGTLAGADIEAAALGFSIIANPTKGTVVITDTASGAFTYTPNAGAIGYDAFTFGVADGTAGVGQATAIVFIGANSARWPGQTVRSSVASGGTQAAGQALSADGRLVFFSSEASNLVAGDTNGAGDVFVRDRQTGQTTRVSVGGDGQATGSSSAPAVSADGRYVAFTSDAPNLVAGDTNGKPDIFIHDRQTGQTKRVSVESTGVEADDTSSAPALSADGRFVAFSSHASNLVPEDTNGEPDVFVHDRQTARTTRVNVSRDGVQANGVTSEQPALSADGRFVAFSSAASNLVSDDANGRPDIFVHDSRSGEITRISLPEADAVSPRLSADGRFVAFNSTSVILPDGTSGPNQVFVHDRQTGQTSQISHADDGSGANGSSSQATVSADGRFVAFSSAASNLVPGDTNGASDVFVHDAQTGRTARVSVAGSGLEADGASAGPVLSADGQFIAFSSVASNLVDGDTNAIEDLFLVGGVSRSPSSQSFSAGGGTGSVDVSFVYPGSPWSAVSDDSWITVTDQSTPSGNGTVTYAVAPNFTSAPRQGTLTVAAQTVTITQAASTGPFAQDGVVATTENAAVTGLLSAIDPTGDPLSFSLVTTGALGTATLTNPATGAFSYTPGLNANGTDSFTFKASDGTTESNIATVTVTIASVNESPVALDGSLTTNEDTAAGGTLAATDADGPALTYTVISNGTKGAVVVPNPETGAFTYTPSPNASGTDSFTFKASDGIADSNIATVTVTIVSLSDPPVSFDGAVATDEDAPATGTLAAVDVDSPSLVISVVSSPTQGAVVVTNVATGAFTYTPNANANGTDTFTFKASDGTSDSNVATVTVTINAVNDAPAASGGSLTTDEDTPAGGTLSATDLDGPPLSFVILGNGTKGSAVVTDAATGAFTYTPQPNATGSDSFTFKATDGIEDSNIATVTVTIAAVNDVPLALDGALATSEDTQASGTLAASDPDGPSLVFSIAAGPTKGAVSITDASTGAFTYTPNANTSGTDSFTFRANDGTANSNVATVQVTITAINDAPVTFNGTVTTNEDTPANGILTATDADGPALTFSIVGNPSKGTVTLNAATAAFTYTPIANANGADVFSYKATDGIGDSAPATVAVTINPVNDAPDARASVVTTVQGTAVNGVLSAIDVDGDPLTFSLSTAPAQGTVTLTDATTGAFTYTPNAGVSGYDPFSFEVSDGHGGPSQATQMVFIGVAGAPRWPGQTIRASVATNGAEGTGTSYGGAPSADGRFIAFSSYASTLVQADGNNHSDVFVHDRKTGQITRVSVKTGGAEANSGSFQPKMSADGRFVTFYSWASNLVPNDTNGTYDVFVHDRQTGQTTRVSVASNGDEANGPSYALALSADGRFALFFSQASNLVLHDRNNAFDVFVHDRQTGQTTRVNVSSNGDEAKTQTYSAALSADGRFVAFNSDASNLVLDDTNGANDVFVHDRQTGQTRRVSLSTTGEQGNFYSYQPALSADGRFVAFASRASNLVPDDTNNTVDVFVHDRQAGQTTRVGRTDNGTELNADSYPRSLSADGRFVAFQSNATNLYLNDTNQTTDVFVHDRQTDQTRLVGVSSSGSPATYFISYHDCWYSRYYGYCYERYVYQTSHEPQLSADGNFVVFQSAAWTLVPNDTNRTDDIFVVGGVNVSPLSDTFEKAGGQGTVDVSFTYPGTPWSAVSKNPWITVTSQSSTNGNGSVSYTVAANTTGATRTGTLIIAAQTVTIHQAGASAPVASDNTLTTSEDTAVAGALAATDENGDPLTFTIVTNGSLGTATVTDPATGAFSYTPNPDAHGTDSFTFKANDGALDSNVATVTVTITPVDDAPVAANSPLTTAEDSAASGILGATDAENSALTFSLVTNGSLGTANVTNPATGAFTYTPNPNANGTDSFTFNASDGALDSNVATITVVITPVNDAPVAVNDGYTTNLNTALTIPANGVLGNDTDVDAGAVLTAIHVSGPAHGSLTVSADGSFTYSPAANYSGPDSFTYQANDGTEISNVATVWLTVTAPLVSLSPGSLAFGEQLVNTTSSSQTMTLTNTGNGLLTLGGIGVTGANAADFSAGGSCGTSLLPGGSCSIAVSFAPTATGTRAAALQVFSNAVGSPNAVPLSGTGTAPIVTLSSTTLSFGNQNVGTTSVAQTVTLTNTGTGALLIASLTVTGVNASDFTQSNSCGSQVAPTASCVINVTFTPTNIGTRAAAVTLTENAAGSPHTIGLTGTGRPGQITLTPGTVSFSPAVPIGTTSGSQQVEVKNTGTTAVTIASIAASSDFAVATSTCAPTLAGGASCFANVTFTPTASGARSGVMAVSGSSGVQTATLTGTGTAVRLQPSPLVDFGAAAVGTTSVMNVTLTNVGSTTVNISSVTITGDSGFTQTNNCTSVAPGASCGVQVSFSPPRTGRRTATLVVNHNDSGGPATVTLTGRGSNNK